METSTADSAAPRRSKNPWFTVDGRAEWVPLPFRQCFSSTVVCTFNDPSKFRTRIHREYRRQSGQRASRDPVDTVDTTAAPGVDPKKDWTPDYEWLDLFEVAELQRMPATEMVKPDVLEDLGKSVLIERLLEHWQPGYVPPALLDVFESSDE